MTNTEPVEKPLQLGLYVHVPFCARHCDFCAFYQQAPSRDDIARYMDGIVQELAELKQVAGRPFDTVFFGGGTPSLLMPADLERLGRAVLDTCGGTPSEWTIEMTPATVRKDRLKVLQELGVNRLSMGVQSFDERILKTLGRLHTRELVYRAIDQVRETGFRNLNLDLMFALPGQSFAQWEADLNEAIAAGPEHISTYCLSFEEDTPLWKRLVRGQTEARSEEEEARFYEQTWEILKRAGLAQYEISNFAHPGHACVHNLNTWRMQEWLGAGPAASSQFARQRWTNVASLGTWLDGLRAHRPARVDEISLDEEMLASDALVFGLRMTNGVDLERLQVRFPRYDWEQVNGLVTGLCGDGLAERCGPFLRLSNQGRLVADQVALAFMEL